MASQHAPKSTRSAGYSVAQMKKLGRSDLSKTIPWGRVTTALARLAKNNEEETIALFAPRIQKQSHQKLTQLYERIHGELRKVDREREFAEKAWVDGENKLAKARELLESGLILRNWDYTFHDQMRAFDDMIDKINRACLRVGIEGHSKIGLNEVTNLLLDARDYANDTRDIRDAVHKLHLDAKERYEI